MNNDIRDYVKSCDLCQYIKASQQVPAGLLQPLPIPKQPWDQVSMDFIVQLPTTKAGFDAIIVFVDTFSKMIYLAPTKSSASALDTACKVGFSLVCLLTRDVSRVISLACFELHLSANL